ARWRPFTRFCSCPLPCVRARPCALPWQGCHLPGPAKYWWGTSLEGVPWKRWSRQRRKMRLWTDPSLRH
ncbi:hypothetical protein E2I00_008855, partial [Balaenoptera physalus]